MSTPTLYDILSQKLEQKRKELPSFRLMEIDNRLFPNAQTKYSTLELEARNSNNELKTVKEIVTESWGKRSKNHLMIEGEGGIGKTVTLLSIPDKFTPSPKPFPSIYIPLHEVNGEFETIEKYIRKRVLNNKEDLYVQLLDLIDEPWDNGPQLMLLLDGFNEITAEKRQFISEDIKYWSEFPGIQIITSSRYDIHTYVALSYDYSTIKLQPLSNNAIEEYLNSTGIPIPVDSAVKKLITVPLLLTLYVKTELILKQRETKSSSFRKVKNAGSIVWNYLQCELWRFGRDNENAKTAIIAMEFIAPYIAWQMQQKSLFVLDSMDFHKLLDDAYKLLKNHFNKPNDLPFHIQDALQRANGAPQLDSIRNLLEEHLCLFAQAGNNYKLMHQQFRDALAAMHLINSIYLNGNSRPTEWNFIVDHYVMQFVADLISEEEANRLWEQNRTSPQLEDATRNQLELQRRLHHCDFSKLDFSGLELSNISLYPYRINNTILKLPTNPNKITRTILSEKTFSVEGHKDSVNAIAVTPNGKYVVSGSRDKTICVWDLETRAPIGNPMKGHTREVTTIAVTPDSKFIVSGSVDKTIRVWDLASGKPIGNPIKGHKSPVNTIALSPDGKYIVSGSVDRTIRIWDLKTGNPLAPPLEGHENWVTAVAVTPDGKHIISGSSDNTIRIWDLNNGAPIGKPIKAHKNWIKTLVVTKDGKRIISGSNDRTIRIWDLETKNPTGIPIEGHKSVVNTVVVTPDGKRIISGSNDNTIRIWDLETPFPKETIIEEHEESVNAIAITPDGKRFVSGSNDNTIRIWDLETGRPIGNPIGGHKSAVHSVVITADGKRIISGSGDKTIRFWDLETMIAVGLPINAHKAAIYTIAVTPDSKRIISGSWDHTIRIWNMNDKKPISIIKGHDGAVNTIVVSPDGQRIVSGSSDQTIRIWDLNTKEALNIITANQGPVYALSMALNPRRIISGSEDNTIRIWDFETGAPIGAPIKEHNRSVNAIAQAPDGKHFVIGSKDKTISIWNMKDGFKKIKSFEAHKYAVTAIAVTPDNKYIVSGSSDDTIRIWNFESCLPYGTPIKEHKGSVYSVAVTPDGKRIVSGAYNGTICITDIETMKVKTIQIHPLSFVGLDFSKAEITDDKLKETLRQNGAIV